jgi:hypothetical protein
MDMVPNFCGLKPDVAQVLVQAFEDHERKLHQKELEEAEREKRKKVTDLIEPTIVESRKAEDIPIPPPKDTEPITASPSMDLSTIDTVEPTISPVVEPVKPPKEAPIVSEQPVKPPSPPRTSSTRIPRTLSSFPQLQAAKLEDFSLVAVLGRGAFGKVLLAKENQTKQLFAIKALKKEFIIQNDDVQR